MAISDNLTEIKRQLPVHCSLIAVTKTHSVEVIKEAYQAGHRVFGENKVQELVPKFESLPRDIEWHLIGHLQSNKVKYIAPFVSLIHSIDSLKLLLEVEKQGARIGRPINCLLQIHIAKEETKFGLSEHEALELIRSAEVKELKWAFVEGLMGMATLTGDENIIRQEFASLRKFFETLKASTLPSRVSMKHLSMGMSSDYRIAIEEGSTMVRVGSAIFGQRNYNHAK